MAISTYDGTLLWGTTIENATQKIKIKDFPDLGGAPDMLETTTLSDNAQTYIKGIQSMGAMEFTVNYTKSDYNLIKADRNKKLVYILEFSDGAFYWEGKHTAHVTGAGVNAVSELKMTIAPSTKPEIRPSIKTVTIEEVSGDLTVDDIEYNFDTLPGTPTLSYRWLKSVTETGKYTIMTGETDDTLASPASGWYRVEVTARGGAGGRKLSNAIEIS